MTNAYERKVLSTIGKTSDIEVHVSVLTAAYAGQLQDLVDIREYIVSLDQYGRGITVPMALKDAIIDGLKLI